MSINQSSFSHCTIIASESRSTNPNAARMDSQMRVIQDPKEWPVLGCKAHKKLQEKVYMLQYGNQPQNVIHMRETIYLGLLNGTYHLSACSTILAVMDARNLLVHPALRDMESGTIIVF